MNVGSILNNDSPPSDSDKTTPPSAPTRTLSHRNSINDLLNESGKAKAPSPKQSLNDKTKKPSPKQLNDKADKKPSPRYRRKPKRYENPPIWAQEWRPSFLNGTKEPVEEAPVESSAASKLSEKHIFDRASMASTDLECSITNTIPPSLVVRTVAEWVYANFVEIPHANRPHVELELKFGTIIDKGTGRRLNINVLTECIYNNPSEIRFDAGIHEVGWNDIKLFLEELEKQYQDELRKHPDPSKNKKKFANLETDITDQIFQYTQRGEAPKKIRVSKDNTLSPPRYIAINKQRISDLYIHNPSSMYDLRLSLSFEHPVPDGNVESILKTKASHTRIKKRSTWSHRPTVTQFDLTKVLVPKESKTKSGKVQVDHDISYEAELEVDAHELFNGFDKFKDGLDNIRFEELVEVFLNNARNLNNRVTRLASSR